MADVFSAAKRSEVMSRIRAKNTGPEVRLRKQLFAHGFRFRIHRKDLPGKPDIVLPMYRCAVFVHGCFWHRHAGCKYAPEPTTNVKFWKSKFDANSRRDATAVSALIDAGWRVAVIWGCTIGPHGVAPDAWARLQRWIQGRSRPPRRLTLP